MPNVNRIEEMFEYARNNPDFDQDSMNNCLIGGFELSMGWGPHRGYKEICEYLDLTYSQVNYIANNWLQYPCDAVIKNVRKYLNLGPITEYFAVSKTMGYLYGPFENYKDASEFVKSRVSGYLITKPIKVEKTVAWRTV